MQENEKSDTRISTLGSLIFGTVLVMLVYVIFVVGIYYSHGEFLLFFPGKLWNQMNSLGLIDGPYRALVSMGLAIFLLHIICSFSPCRTCSCILFCVYLVVQLVVVSVCTVALRSI